VTKAKQPKIGIYPNMPFKDYLAIDAVSNSYLSQIKDCPAKALVEVKETPAMIFGRAAHSFILEGEKKFDTEYIVSPKFDRRPTAGKKAYERFCELAKTKTIISAEDFLKIRNMNSAVYNHPMAKKLLAGGTVEQTIIWKEPVTGILCKSRLDVLPDEKKGAVVDLKTTNDSSEYGFRRSIIKYGYHRQGAFYPDALYNVKVGKVGKNTVYDAFIIIAVEKKEPYAVNCFFLSPELIEYGRQEYLELLRVHKKCKEEKSYPHWNDPEDNGGLITVELPGYLG